MFLQCDWSVARPRLGRLAHNLSSHPIIRCLRLHMLVASQRGDRGSTWKTGRTGNESVRWMQRKDAAFLHSPVNFTIKIVVEHMFHCCVCVCVQVLISVSTFVLYRLFPFIIQDRFLDVVLKQCCKQWKHVAYLFKGQSEMNGKVEGKCVPFTLLHCITNWNHFIVRYSHST